MMYKKFSLYLLGLVFLTCFSVKAQMQTPMPAKKVTLDVDTSVVFNVKRSVVWNLVKDPSQWNLFLGKEVTAFNSTGVIGEGPEHPTTMEIKMTFADGVERMLKVAQFTPQYRLIVLKVLNPVQAGITDNFFLITVDSETETSCKAAFRMKVDGPEPAKSELLSRLKREMRAFIGGIAEKTGSL
jgi:hypothetical protein